MQGFELLFSCEFSGCSDCRFRSFAECIQHRDSTHLRPSKSSKRKKKRRKSHGGAKIVSQVSLALQPVCVGYQIQGDSIVTKVTEFDVRMKGMFCALPLLSVFLHPFELCKLAGVCRSWKLMVDVIEGVHLSISDNEASPKSALPKIEYEAVCMECKLARYHALFTKHIAPLITANIDASSRDQVRLLLDEACSDPAKGTVVSSKKGREHSDGGGSGPLSATKSAGKKAGRFLGKKFGFSSPASVGGTPESSHEFAALPTRELDDSELFYQSNDDDDGNDGDGSAGVSTSMVLDMREGQYDRLSFVHKLYLTYFLSNLGQLRWNLERLNSQIHDKESVSRSPLLFRSVNFLAHFDAMNDPLLWDGSEYNRKVLSCLSDGHLRHPLTCSEAYSGLISVSGSGSGSGKKKESPKSGIPTGDAFDSIRKRLQRRGQWRTQPFIYTLDSVTKVVLSENSIAFAVTQEADLFVPFVINAGDYRSGMLARNRVQELILRDCHLVPSNLLNLCSGLLWSKLLSKNMRYSQRLTNGLHFYLNRGLTILNLSFNSYIDDESMDPLLASLMRSDCIFTLRQLWLNSTSVSDITCGLLAIFFRQIMKRLDQIIAEMSDGLGTEESKSKDERSKQRVNNLIKMAVILTDNQNISALGVNTVDRLYKDNVLTKQHRVIFAVTGCRYQYRDRPESQGYDPWDERIVEKEILCE